MVSIYFHALLLMFFSSTFHFAYVANGINRSVYGFNRSIIEKSIISFNQSGVEETPYFNKAYLEDNSKNYFHKSLDRITKDYSLSFSYFQSERLTSYQDRYDIVQIDLKAKLFHVYPVEKSIHFKIMRKL